MRSALWCEGEGGGGGGVMVWGGWGRSEEKRDRVKRKANTFVSDSVLVI